MAVGGQRVDIIRIGAPDGADVLADGTVQQLERPPLVAQVIVQQHDESTLPTGISTTTSLRSSHQRAQARQRA